MSSYDLVVVGGGPGGYTAALHAAKRGAKVALVEEKELGGTCLNVGCIPTKTLLASSKLLTDINKKSKQLGVKVASAEIDLPKVIARKDRVVKRLAMGIQGLFKKNNIELIKGKAKLDAKGKLSVADKEISYKKLIWASGSKPRSLPKIPFSKNVLSSTELLQVQNIPKTLVVIGAGVIGIEMATFFSAIGTKVTIVEMLKQALLGVDKEAGEIVQKSLERSGVKFNLGMTVDSVKEQAEGVEVKLSDNSSLVAEKVLNAVGREAVLSGSEAAGLELTDKKTIKVNEKLETSRKNVYAIGDVTGISWLAHVAAYQGEVAAENAVGGERAANYKAVPSCIFSDPEIAFVGNSNKDQEVKKTPLNILGKMQADGENEGFIKIALNKKSKKVEAVTIVGPHASDLLNEGILSVQLGLSEKELSKVIRPHPTLGEIYSEAYLGTHQ